ncbi:MAG: hypothetical protein ACPLXC_02265 [Candidatus Pacearchaeota archaeon]
MSQEPIDLKALLEGTTAEKVETKTNEKQKEAFDPFFGGPILQHKERTKRTTLFIIDKNLNGKTHEHSVIKRFLNRRDEVGAVYTISNKSSLDTYSKIYTRGDEKVICIAGDYREIITNEELEAFRKKHDADKILLKYENPRQFLCGLSQHSTLTGIKFDLKNLQDKTYNNKTPAADYDPSEIELKSEKAIQFPEPPEVNKPFEEYQTPEPIQDFVGEILESIDNTLENILHPKSENSGTAESGDKLQSNN